MAQIVLRNNREHDININYINTSTQEVATIIIPAARASELDANTMMAGEAVADDAIIKAAIKKYAAVKHYFDAGWLQFANSMTVKATPQESE